MPNNCENIMTITGPDAEVRGFVDRAHGCRPLPTPTAYDKERHEKRHPGTPYPKESEPVVLEFHRIVPLPDSYSKHDYSDHGWNLERETWGVKWGAYDLKPPVVEDGRAQYAFTTAWACPKEWLAKASKSWPTLTFIVTYSEEYPTRGKHAVISGVVLYDFHDQNIPEPIGYDPEADDDAYYEASKKIRDEFNDNHEAFVQEILSAHPSTT